MQVTYDSLPQAVSHLYEKLASIERLLLNQREVQVKTETEQFLSIQEASVLVNLSVPTIYGLVHRSLIPVCKRGKKLYFSKDELTNWIMTGRKKTFSEITADASAYLSKSFNGKRNG